MTSSIKFQAKWSEEVGSPYLFRCTCCTDIFATKPEQQSTGRLLFTFLFFICFLFDSPILTVSLSLSGLFAGFFMFQNFNKCFLHNSMRSGAVCRCLAACFSFRLQFQEQ